MDDVRWDAQRLDFAEDGALPGMSSIKGLLRSAGARTKEALHSAIASALDAFTPTECSNYLRHDGYAPT